MRAIEPQTRTTEEITAGIIEALDGSPAIEEYVRALVKAARSRLLKHFGPFPGNQKANAKIARRLLKWIDEGEKLLNEPSKGGGATFEIFFGLRQSTSDSVERLETAARQARARYKDHLDRLESLRQRCEWIIQAKIGEHGNAGYLQTSAAIVARYLCEKAGKPLAWSSRNSTYRVVAGYFYEVMTGKRDHELERACKFTAEQVLKNSEKITSLFSEV
jgi:hypothetical protein